MANQESKSYYVIVTLVSLLGLALAFFGARNGLNAYKSSNWPTTEGLITLSEVEGNSRYIPKLLYTYCVDAVDYSSDKIRLTNTSQYKKKDGAEKVIAKYPLSAKVKVFYNPSKHDEAILDPGIKGEHLFMCLIGLVIFLGAGYGLIYAIRKAKQG